MRRNYSISITAKSLRYILTCLIASLLLATRLSAQDSRPSYDSLAALGPFPSLEKLEFTGGTIYYNPEIAELINSERTNLDPNGALYNIITALADDIFLFKSPILEGSTEKFIFAFSWGPSDDFCFIVYKDDENCSLVGGMDGYRMYVPGNGYVYVEGHTNNSFNHRKKYMLKEGKFVESKQAFYYVGLKTVTNAPVKLYADTTYTEIIAGLTENQPVEVLIADFRETSHDSHDFLIRTPFGLTGWVRIIDPYPRSWYFWDIYYAGD